MTEPLPFDPGPRRTFPLSKTCAKHRDDDGTSAWRRIKSSRPGQCHECVAWLYENKATLPFPCSSAWERKSTVGVLRLCFGHAQQWRDYDGVDRT